MKITPRSFRFFTNLYPQYLFSRTKVKYVSPDWKEVIVRIKKSLLTRNYVGTTFGGSLYQAADPFFMLMLIQILGIKNYIIWDQSAEIFFLKPARSMITFHFKITDEDLEKIHESLKEQEIIRPVFTVTGKDEEGVECIKVMKTIYIKKKG